MDLNALKTYCKHETVLIISHKGFLIVSYCFIFAAVIGFKVAGHSLDNGK